MNKIPNQVSISLGDKRLDKRYKKIEEEAFKQPSSSLSALFQDWHQTKAIYRFFDNPKVTYEKIMEHLSKQTIDRVKRYNNHKDIFVLQDTSHFNYSGHKNKTELSSTHPNVKKGIKAHPSIVVTPCRINLGLLHLSFWPKEKEGEKESNKWHESFDATEKLAQQCPEKNFFNIADREADIYDLLLEVSKKNLENLYFIIRSSIDRTTNTKEGKLRKTIDNAPKLGEISFELKKGDKKRIVHQTIKVKKMELNAPKHISKKEDKEDKVEVWVVQAEEINPPKGEKPIKWIILTDYPVKSLDDAVKIVKYYAIRWDIEIFFKVLKSGCQVEEIRLETLDRLKPCLAFYMSIACRIMFLLKVGRTYPNLPCNILFSTAEWQVVYIATNHKKLPKKPPPLSVIITGIAKLGGYLNRKNDPPPGPKAMWIGIQKMHMMAFGFEFSENKT